MSKQTMYPRIDYPITMNFYLDLTREATTELPMQGYLLPHPSPAQANTYPPLNAVREPVPFDLPIGKINFWNGTEWEVQDDHRQVMDERGRIIEDSGTPYWLPEDTYQSPARYLTTYGPLPDDAILTKPVKPLPTFNETKTTLLEKLAGDVKEAETNGYTMSVLGFNIDATERSYTDTQGLITKMTERGIDKEMFCDHENQFREVTMEEVKTIHLEIIEYGQFIYAQKWKLRTIINSITEDDQEEWRGKFEGINWDKDLNLIPPK